MACRQCGAEIAPDADRCDSCGAPAGERVGSGDADVAVARAGSAAGSRTLTFRFGRLTRGDRIAGVSSGVVFIALLLPWYGTTVTGFTVDGLWHGWMYLTLLLALATVGYLVARAITEVRIPVVHWQVLLGATGALLLLAVLGLVTTPSGATLEWGAIVGLIAAVAAFAGAMLRRREADPA